MFSRGLSFVNAGDERVESESATYWLQMVNLEEKSC